MSSNISRQNYDGNLQPKTSLQFWIVNYRLNLIAMNPQEWLKTYELNNEGKQINLLAQFLTRLTRVRYFFPRGYLSSI